MLYKNWRFYIMHNILKKTIYIGLTLLCTLFITNTVYANTRGVVTGDVVNVRAYSEISDTNRLFQVNRGDIVNIVGVCGEFFRANINGSYNVYISREWVRISETYGTLQHSSAFIYDLPREEGGVIISTVSGDTTLTVVSSFENWFGITYNGELVFVEKSSVSVPYFVQLQTARMPRAITFGQEVVEFAMQYLGSRYVFGGTTPAGFDCSGFMLYIMRNFDIGLNRVSRDQATNGVHVNRSELQPADLVFFAASPGGSRITHVGMYIGGGQFIHASTWNTGVRISDLNSAHHTVRFVTARRVI